MYRERVLLGHGYLLELEFSSAARWKLSFRKGRKRLVEYASDASPEIKSVEQLRYDFERDVENAQRPGR
jgi:hypothetical protein